MLSGKLTVAKVRQFKEPGRYADGGCLYLVVAPGGSKSWVARLTVRGKQTDLGLGGVSYVTLQEARDETARLRRIARQGGDPAADRRKSKVTFADAAESVFEGLRPTWRNQKHADTWIGTLRKYAYPEFGNRQIETITTADCLKVLSPIWVDKQETAKRLKQRLNTVFDWAKAAGHYSAENPINGITRALPSVKRSAVHLNAMPWQEVPGFFEQLGQRESVAARALEFVILTAARSGEVRLATWDEIDGVVWTVPGPRMKRGVLHRVPLSAEALGVLDRVRGLDSQFLFPSPQGRSSPLSDAALMALLRRMGVHGPTVHGFRSAFRDWASDWAHANREVAEAALSHAVGNEVERAYARSDLFKRRAELMKTWGEYCSQGSSSYNVIGLN
ncbi:MAG TPA: integrase [Maritimibacter sp.]|nr:integrase [Maritimibacter sp.]